MPSQLTTEVRKVISSLLAHQTSKEGGQIAADVLRAIRDESTLLMELQLIHDTLDSDPLQIFQDDQESILRKQVQRIQKLLNVLEISRCTMRDGSSIHAVVEIQRDSETSDSVEKSLRLTFSYERKPFKVNSDSERNGEPKRNEEKRFESMETTSEDSVKRRSSLGSPGIRKKRPRLAKQFSPTHIAYNIEVSRDYGKKERLLGVDVYAAGNSPSVEQAIVIDDDDSENYEEFDDEGNAVQKKETHSKSNKEQDFYDCLLCDGRDRFDAYLDPDCMDKFLEWTGLWMDFENLLFILMSFPFYEHEWDIMGFLLDCMFVDEDESSSTGSR